jgi:hypothetical protein
VGIGDHQADSAETTGVQRAQELGPERLVLGVSDVESQHFTAPVGRDARSHDDRLGHDPVVDPGLAIGRIKEHVRERHRRQIAAGECPNLKVEVGADPGDLGLGDPRVGAQGFDEVVDLAGRDARPRTPASDCNRAQTNACPQQDHPPGFPEAVVCPGSTGFRILGFSCHGDDAVALEFYRAEPFRMNEPERSSPREGLGCGITPAVSRR